MTMHMPVQDAASFAAFATVAIENGFDFLSEEYRRLFARSGATAFQGPEWLDSLYRVLVPAVGARPHIVTVRQIETGELRLVIPLVVQQSMDMRILQPADLGVSDYNTVISAPATLKAYAADHAVKRQIGGALDAGDVLFFRKIPRCPEAIAALLGGGLRARNENDGHEIMLDGATFEEWQKTRLKKKFRKGTLKRLHNLEEALGPVEFRTFREPAEIEAAIRFIAAQRPARFKDDILARRAYLDFYLHHALAGAESGAAVTTGLTIQGELVAANFGIVSGEVYHSLLCAARLAELKDYAPGLQAMLWVMRQRHGLGETRFDFGIGGGRHKTDLSAQSVPLYNLTVSRSVSGSLISLVYNRARPLKKLISRIGHLR